MKKLSYFEIVLSNISTTVTEGIINLHTSKILSRRYGGTERSGDSGGTYDTLGTLPAKNLHFSIF